MNDEYSINNEIKAEPVRIIFKSLLASQIGIFLTAIILVILMRDHSSISSLFTWLAIITFTITFRLLILKQFNKVRKKNSLDTQYWEKLFTFGVLLSAISWGSVSFILNPEDSIVHQAYITISLTGIIAASVGTLSPILRTLVIFVFISFIPFIINILQFGGDHTANFIALIIFFMGITLFTGVRFNQGIKKNIQIKYDSILRKSELEKSENRYRLLYEKSEDPMFLFSGTEFKMINQAAVKLFGYRSMRHLLKTPAFNLSPVFQPNNIKSTAKAAYIFRITNSKGHYNTEWICRHYDGHTFPVDVTLTLIPNKDKRKNEIFCVFRDITQKKELENELRLAQEKSEKAKQKADEASDAKSDFLANMSHEIRTPMNGVIGTAEILLKTELSQQQLNYTHTIKNSALSMLTIVNDILDYSKIEAGMFDIDKHQFNLKDLIKQFTSSIVNKINQKGIRFIVKSDSKTDRWYLGDSGRIRQILTNLVGNSLKFTEQGSITLICKIVNEENNISEIEFKIIDTGIGISKEKQKKIFSRFTQADGSTTRKYGGTGLGLSISKQLTTLMDGDIGFESDLGKGTQFWFAIKLENSEQPESIGQSSNDEVLSQFNSKVLVVEDNKTNQMVARGMLELFGLKIDIVDNGKKALERLEKFDYDLVFMDCHMPILDGYKATQEIRRNNSTIINPKIPVIAMTASAMQGDREKCIAYGMDDYITKPVNLNDLEDMLNKWLVKSKVKLIKAKIENKSKETINKIETNFIHKASLPEKAADSLKENKEVTTKKKTTKKKVSKKVATKKKVSKKSPKKKITKKVTKKRTSRKTKLSKGIPKSNEQIYKDSEQFGLKPSKSIAELKASAARKKLNEKTKVTKNLEPIFDYDAINQRLSGNVELIQSIVARFVPSMHKQIQDLLKCIESKNMEKIVFAAHKLKGSAATIGCMQLSTYAFGIENAGKEENINTVIQTAKFLNQSYIDSKKAIDSILFNG